MRTLGHTRATWRDWIRGARPSTLALSLAPIPVGYGAARALGEAHLPITALALTVAVFLQIGVNFANDYSDGVRGTDDVRTGPPRLTGAGLARPRTVLTVALVFFALAAAAGVVIVVLTEQWWLLAVGAAAILAAFFYTGGRRPYGYYGLGEVAVFVFFGLVAVIGTAYVNNPLTLTGTPPFVSQEALFGGIALGALAAAVLIANNIRDIPQDRAAKKRTLSVLIGTTASRVLFVLLSIGVPALTLLIVTNYYSLAWFAAFALLLVGPACVIVCTAKTSGEYVLALKLTSVGTLVYGIALGVGYVFVPSPF